MKKPKLSKLRVHSEVTRKVRKQASADRSIKITINIDADSIEALKKMSSATGLPYQRLLNQILKAGLVKDKLDGSRLDKLEREIKALKKLVA